MNQSKKMNLLIILSICTFLVGFDSIVTIPLIPLMSKDTNLPVNLSGLLVTSYAIAYAIFAPFFGSLSDRVGRKKILIFGLFIFSLATTFTGLANTFSTLIIFRILSGIGAGMIEPNVLSIVGDRFEYENRGKAIGIVTAALISSAIVGVPLGGYIAEYFSWRVPFFVIGVVSIFSLILVSISINETNKQITSPSIVMQVRATVSSSTILFALTATLLYYGGLQGMFVYSGVFYSEIFNSSTSLIGFILMGAGIGSVLGSVIGGKLADKFGKKKVVIFAVFFVGISVLFLSLSTHSFQMAILIHFIWATVYGIGQTAFTALISELNPKYRGTIMALISSAMYLGSGLFTAIVAVVFHNNNFVSVGIICALANLLVLLIVSFKLNEVNKTNRNIVMAK